MDTPNFEHLSLMAFFLTFIGGVITGFNPCCYTMIPAVCGYLCGYSVPTFKRCFLLSSLFALGVATATALLGLVVVLIGGFFGGLPSTLYFLLALVPIVMGLHLLGAVKLKMPGLTNWKPVRTGAIGAYLTGLVFSMVILPCATPVLASVLSFAAGRGGLLFGTGLLFTYGAGIGVPLVLFGTSIGLVARLRSAARWWSVINQISGVILILTGLYLLWRA
jgi:cytochrome c-type biogenesis protein